MAYKKYQTNFKRSFQYWFGTNFAASFDIDYGGYPFNSDDLSEWLQVRSMVGGRQYHRHVNASSDYGYTTGMLTNINIFVKPSPDTPADRTTQIRDSLFNVMKPNQKFVVKEYTGASATLCWAISREIITDSEIPPNAIVGGAAEDIYQYNLTIQFDFLEAY